MRRRRCIAGWLSLITLLVLAAGCGDDDEPSLSVPPELHGSWSEGSTIVTLTDCAVGERCGLLELTDNNGNHCAYWLVYLAADADAARLATSMPGPDDSCAYSPWHREPVLVRLTPGTDDTIEVVAEGVAQTAVTLHRASTPPILSLPAELYGAWSAGSTTATLAACATGEECGRLELVDDNGEQCVYLLVYLAGDADGFRLRTSGGDFACGYSPWSHNVVRLTPASDDTIDLDNGFGTPITLRRDGR